MKQNDPDRCPPDTVTAGDTRTVVAGAVSAKPKGTLYPDTGCLSRIIVIDVYICMKHGQ